MQHRDSSLDQVLGPGWALLGELELAVKPDTDRTVNKWLMVILSPLRLHADFVKKVLKSAEEAAARAMQNETVLKLQHTHLLVFVTADHPSSRQNWGFFRIEKIAAKTDDQARLDHDIELYLYREG